MSKITRRDIVRDYFILSAKSYFLPANYKNLPTTNQRKRNTYHFQMLLIQKFQYLKKIKKTEEFVALLVQFIVVFTTVYSLFLNPLPKF